LRALGAKIGIKEAIKDKVIISKPENFTIGNGVSINQYCYLSCSGGVTIGNDVSIAYGVTIITSSHDYTTAEKIKYAPLLINPITIGSNVWIGMNSMILSGVLINYNVVVGAGALVNKEVSSSSIVGGLPARVLSEILRKEI